MSDRETRGSRRGCTDNDQQDCWDHKRGISKNTYIVPISPTALDGVVLEAEGTFPGAGLSLGQRDLAGVAIPRTEQMHGLDVGGGAEGKVELHRDHDGIYN